MPLANAVESRRARSRQRQAGFTLLELMIVIAMIGVLLAIAIPAYNEQVRKSRRALAQGCLSEMAQAMERDFAIRLRYTELRDGTARADAPQLSCRTEMTEFYTVTLPATELSPTTYMLVATPVAGSIQAPDACGEMSLNHAGVKTPASPADCWR